MSCEFNHETLAAFAMGLLDDGETQAVQTHSLACQACQSKLRNYARSLRYLRQQAVARPDPVLTQRILAHTQATVSVKKRSWLWQGVVATGLALLLPLGGYWIFQGQTLLSDQAFQQAYAEDFKQMGVGTELEDGLSGAASSDGWWDWAYQRVYTE